MLVFFKILFYDFLTDLNRLQCSTKILGDNISAELHDILPFLFSFVSTIDKNM